MDEYNVLSALLMTQTTSLAECNSVYYHNYYLIIFYSIFIQFYFLNHIMYNLYNKIYY